MHRWAQGVLGGLTHTLTRGDWGGKIPPILENRGWGSEGEKEKRGEEREKRKGEREKKEKKGKRKEKKEGKRKKEEKIVN